jgi:hypothetical protein
LVVAVAPLLSTRPTWIAKARPDTTASDDRADGNLLRTQTAAAGIAVNAERLWGRDQDQPVQRGDVLVRLLAAIERERKRQEEA